MLGESGIESGVVTLHEVTLDAGLEIDSVQVSSDGSFEFVLPRVPDPESGGVFFASTEYEDILYFGQPLNRPIQLDSTYVIHVYETVEAPPGGLTFPVAVRNVFLQEAGEGWSAVDLIQIRNDGVRTIVASGDDPIWSYPLLGGARDFEVGQSDLAEDAVRFDHGLIHVSAPIPPGERLYVVRYLIPGQEFVAPLPGNTETMELLVREPARPTVVTGLQQLASVEVEEGVTYRRYVGADIIDDAVGLILADEAVTIPVAWVSVILAFLLTAAGIYAMQRGSMAPASVLVTGAADRRGLLREVAILDEAFEREGRPGGKAGKAYRRRRGEILRQMDDLRDTGR